MTPEEARDTLAGMLIHANVIAPHHAHDAIAVVLADVPLLMQAIGAEQMRQGEQHVHPSRQRIWERWVTAWQEVSGE